VKLRTDALRTAVTRGLAPGQFRSLGHDTTLYFRAADPDGTLRDVFMQRDFPEMQRGRMQIVLASQGRYTVSTDSNYYTIELGDGRSYEGTPGAGAWRITQFRQQTIRVPTPQATLPGRPRLDQLPTGTLLGSPRRDLQAELHWRIGWVVIVIVLGLLVPWAVLLFAAYAGLLTTGRLMLERGDVPGVFGLWGVHAAIIAAGATALQWPQWRAALRRKAASRAG
jgi:lipopolysaccharide export system permease protein